MQDGNNWICQQTGVVELDFEQEAFYYETLLDSITSLTLAGPELVLGPWLKRSKLLATQALDTMLSLYQISFKNPTTGHTYKRLLLKTEEQKMVAALFELI